MKKMDTHHRRLSGFHLEKALAKRICSECKEVIPKGSNCLVGFLVDTCLHKANSGSPFSCHIRLQMCLKCAKKEPQKYLKRYPLEYTVSWHETNLKKCIDTMHHNPDDIEQAKNGKRVAANA